MKIKKDEFDKLKYGCPSYDCTYGSKCPATKKQCHYEACPFVYWLSCIEKKSKK